MVNTMSKRPSLNYLSSSNARGELWSEDAILKEWRESEKRIKKLWREGEIIKLWGEGDKIKEWL